MPRLPRGKKLLQAYVSEDLLKEFRELAFRKHGVLRGALSWEVEEALKNWLALNNTHKCTQIKPLNPGNKILKVYNQVKEYIKEKYYYGTLMPHSQVPRKFLVEAIMAIRGPDKRTVRGWLDRFMKFKLIKYLGGEIFEMT